MNHQRASMRAFLMIMAVAWLIALSVVWFRASMEAATFRRLTGKPATTWDALWADLRVVGEAGGGK